MRVFLHGFTGTPSAWDAVADDADVALALPGHGAPPSADWDGAIDALADQLADLPGPLHLVGYSLGGRLVLGLLAAGIPHVARATVVGAHPGLTDPAERAARRAADDALADDIVRDGLDAFVRRWEALPMWASQARLPDDVRERQRVGRLSHDPRGLAGSLRGQGLGRMPDLRRRLEGVGVPVAVVVGELDGKFLPIARDLADLLPRATLHVVPGVGHNVPLEAPEAFARLLT